MARRAVVIAVVLSRAPHMIFSKDDVSLHSAMLAVIAYIAPHAPSTPQSAHMRYRQVLFAGHESDDATGVH